MLERPGTDKAIAVNEIAKSRIFSHKNIYGAAKLLHVCFNGSPFTNIV